MLLLLMAIAAMSSPSQAATPAPKTCAPQPMPPAIDSAGELPVASETIEFAATPELQYPGRAWVVRLSRRGPVEAIVEVLRLRRQSDCNRYDIESRWQAPLRQDEYGALAARVVPLAIPPSTVFVPSSAEQLPELVLDGTGIELRLRSPEWRVTRALNHYGLGGAVISAIFRDLASKYVPASDMPAKDWRTVSNINDCFGKPSCQKPTDR